MKILYISSGPSKKEYKYIQSMVKDDDLNSSYGMPEASYKFHKLIREGLIENDCIIESLVGRSVSYKTHSGLIWKKHKSLENKILYRHLFFINLPIIKQLCICIEMFFSILFWLLKNRKEKKAIIIDGSYVTVLPVLNLVTLFSNTNKIAIICDVYNYMADVKDANVKTNLRNMIMNKIMKYQYRQIDGFVFLTKEMSKIPAFKDKPFVVVEGIVDKEISEKTKFDNYIMYAGALRSEYGVERLIKAFTSLENNDFELLLFGNGNYVSEIKKIASLNKKIKYMGKKSLEEVYEYEKNATLLVNPRFVKDEYTKYSFPSKNLEYMLSGTPLLTGSLPGMPEEYYDYVYLIEDDSVDSLKSALKNILKKPLQELKKNGRKAQKFISTCKNKYVQTKKIIELDKNISHMKNTKKNVHTIFNFNGINKYIPIILSGGFFLCTILLFIFGPYDWHINNANEVYSFLIASFVFLIFGYCLAIKFSKIYSVSKYYDINKILSVCIVIYILIYIPTVYIRTGKLYPDIITGIFNSGYAYSIAHSSNSTLIEYLRIIFSPFIVIVTPLCFLYFKNLSKVNKILGIICTLLTLFLGISCGISKQFADFVIQVFIFSSLLFFSNNFKSAKKKLFLVLFLILVSVSFILYYKTIMTNRISTDIDANNKINNSEIVLSEEQKNNHINDNNINNSSLEIIDNKKSLAVEENLNSEKIENTMKSYSTFGYANLRKNNFIIDLLPSKLKTATLYLISYITHGYKGLSFAMSKDFTSAYGLGFSEFARHNVSRLFGKDFEEKIYKRTYMSKIEENGWYTLDVWSSFFVYPASDIGFILTVVLMLFIGFAFGYSWKDTLITGNMYSAICSYNFIIMVFYLSANNQLFQTGESFVSSFIFFVIYIFQILNRRLSLK